MKMPGMTGVELMQAMQAKKPDCLFIMVTGTSELDTALQALRLGAYDFIQKPFRTEELLNAVHRTLERQRLTRENDDYKNNIDGNVASATRHLEEKIEKLSALNEVFQKHMNMRQGTESAFTEM